MLIVHVLRVHEELGNEAVLKEVQAVIVYAVEGDDG